MMKFTMTVPCNDCPFRREGGIKLRASRIREIAGMILDSQGGTFPCHKSVDYSTVTDNEADSRINRNNEVHCAGALAFAEKNGNATQMMRIAERCGEYDARAITDDIKDQVWDSKSEWLKDGKI